MKKRLRLERDNIAYIFLLPNFIIYGSFVLIPLLQTFYLSFTDFNLFEKNWVGFDNYLELLKDDKFHQAVVNTFKYTMGTIFISMGLGLALAIALNGNIPGKKAFRTVFYLPNIVSVVVSAMAWLYIYNPNNGILNIILESVGLPTRRWLIDVDLALWCIVLMSIWASMGYNMIVYLAGLQGIPKYLYEAAEIDGANKMLQFRKITFPMLAPTTFFLLVMVFIHSFQVFGQVYIMTNGGPMNTTTTIVHQIYNNGFEGYKMGYASAQAVFLLVVTLLVTLLNFRYGNRGGDLEVA